MNLLLFAGTSEGRLLAEKLSTLSGLTVTVCVATEYGKEIGRYPSGFTVLAERLGERAMARLMNEKKWDMVVDTTHPYAVEVSANIHRIALAASIPYLRLLREEGEPLVGCRLFSTVQEAAKALCDTEGNVLLATGSKDLESYTIVPRYAERLYPRVLPTVESIEKCVALGFLHSHIIAMQGPFSVSLNKALMGQYHIDFLVTKDGGKEGGFAEKMEAADSLGIQVFLIKRPTKEEGMRFDELWSEIVNKWGKAS